MEGRGTRARVLLLLAISACALLATECSRSHVQETVTVAPRSTATPAPTAIADANSISASPAVDIETEAAGDSLAHAIVALKSRRRDDALHFMSLAHTRLNRVAAETNTKSDPTHERIVVILSELDAAERSLRHNAYEQSRAQLRLISDELDHLLLNLNHHQT